MEQEATWGGGCFWCMEAVFERWVGVHSVTSGYAGGTVPNPTYHQVCTGQTGHAEVILIKYDPQKVRYEELLNLFWLSHDPTTRNRQGADVGTQYRSIILYHNEEQRDVAERSKKEMQAGLTQPIETEVVGLTHFYPAEEDHQDYYSQNPDAPYCRAVILPKLQKLKLKSLYVG